MPLFYITAVRMNQANTHIDSVKIVQAGKRMNEATINSRQFVAELINKNAAEFKTWVRIDGEWKVGAQVHVVDDVYLSTDRNSTKRDNLANLPRF